MVADPEAVLEASVPVVMSVTRTASRVAMTDGERGDEGNGGRHGWQPSGLHLLCPGTAAEKSDDVVARRWTSRHWLHPNLWIS